MLFPLTCFWMGKRQLKNEKIIMKLLANDGVSQSGIDKLTAGCTSVDYKRSTRTTTRLYQQKIDDRRSFSTICTTARKGIDRDRLPKSKKL